MLKKVFEKRLFRKRMIILLGVDLLLAVFMVFSFASRGFSAEINQKITEQKKAESAAYAAQLLGTEVSDIEIVEYQPSFMDKVYVFFAENSGYFIVAFLDVLVVLGYSLLSQYIKAINGFQKDSVRSRNSNSNIFGILLALAVLFLDLSILSDKFLTYSNLINVLQQININFIVAVGMTFVIISGGIDLSVGSNMGLTALFMAMMMNYWNIPVPVVIITGVAMSALMGFLNGQIITKFGIPPFIATLGTMYVGRGLAYTITGGRTISDFPEPFKGITSRVWGFPLYSSLIMLAVFVLGLVILNNTCIGRFTYSIGGNEDCSRLSGINIKKYKTIVYLVSGVCCGIAAVILGSRLNSATVTNAEGYEMDAIAAVVIGGTSMSGGEGNLYGTLVGIFFIGFISNGLNLLGVGQGPQKIVKGIIIVIAVIIDVTRRKATEKR